MIEIKIKPLSQNAAWQGRRWLTLEAKSYIEQVLWSLPPKLNIEISKKDKVALYINVGLSNKNADLTNVVKLFEDCLCKKYNWNDRQVYQCYLKKEDVKKGCEYISFELKKL